MNAWERAVTRRPWVGLHIRGLLQLVLFSAIFVSHLFDFTDPDFFFHLRTGRYIWETRSIPDQDIFSHTAAGRDWVTHEWLSQVALHLTNEAFGYAGLVIFYSALTTLALYLMYRLIVKLDVHELLAMLLVAWAAVLMFPFFTVRPVAFTWVFFVGYLDILYQYRRTGTARLWLLPGGMLLWVNLHGGFIIGLLLIAALLAVQLIEQRFLGRRRRPLRPLVIALLFTVLATLANPSFTAGFTYPFTYLGSDNASLQILAEWQSPDFHNVRWMVFFGGAVVLLMALGVWRRSLGLWPPAVAALVTVLALQSVRQIPLFALAALPVLGEVLADRFAAARAAARPSQPAGAQALNWGVIVAVWAVVLVTVPGLPNYHVQSDPLPTRGISYPEEAAPYIRENYPDARMFNMYVWGGYLLNHLYPEQKVFIDGRADVYGSRLLQDYVAIADVGPDWRTLLEDYEIELVLFAAESPLAEALRLDSRWEEVFRTTREAIFVRDST